MSYRRSEFDADSVKYWLLPEIKSLIKHKQIVFYPCTQPKQITADHVVLGHSIEGECNEEDGNTAQVEADFVLLLTGYVMDTTLLEQAGVDLIGDSHAPKIDPETMQTNVPGLYIAGTAAAGSQIKFRLFIENCHPHVTRIVKAITGQCPPPGLVNQSTKEFDLPES